MALNKLKKQRQQERLNKYQEKVARSIFSGDFVDKGQLYRLNFVRGVFFGLGTFVGGTIVVAMLIWLLTFFSEIPFIGELVETVRNSLN